MDGRYRWAAHWAITIFGLLALQPCLGMLCKGSAQQDVDWYASHASS